MLFRRQFNNRESKNLRVNVLKLVDPQVINVCRCRQYARKTRDYLQVYKVMAEQMTEKSSMNQQQALAAAAVQIREEGTMETWNASRACLKNAKHIGILLILSKSQSYLMQMSQYLKLNVLSCTMILVIHLTLYIFATLASRPHNILLQTLISPHSAECTKHIRRDVSSICNNRNST